SRNSTRWVISPMSGDPNEAVAVTPGGGRMGTLMGGALDHAVMDAAAGTGDSGRIVEVPIGPAESAVGGLPAGTTVTLALIPGGALPAQLWEDLAERQPVRFAFRVEGRLLEEAELLDPGEPGIELSDERLVTSLVPDRRVIISGGGPIADALAGVFTFLGWQPSVIGEPGTAAAVMATLSAIDAVVVMGHDVEAAGRGLEAAVKSRAGYIGSIGSPRMQELRREWLSLRGVAWDDRIRGPAGVDIGADTPEEIALSVAAEAVSNQRAGGPDR
ncbi:MAG: XdhC family protein, partial [Acidimicrobiia bacterium]|nr:XdhC family protein [Acidimicrobiia bacterium]